MGMTTTKATAKNITAGSMILLVKASNGSMVKASTEAEIKRATIAKVTGVEFEGRYHRVVTEEFGALDWANSASVYRFTEAPATIDAQCTMDVNCESREAVEIGEESGEITCAEHLEAFKAGEARFAAESAPAAMEALKGQSYTTGAVHRAEKRSGHLVQSCGMGRRQVAYLAPVAPGTAVTCKRCS